MKKSKYCTFYIVVITILYLLSADASGISTEDVFGHKVDKLLSQWDHPDYPGCVIAIARNGRMVFSRGYGIANLDYGVFITSKTVFDIGSMSKQFTAACIALLAIDGKLSLDDDIRKYIPELPEYDTPITVRHLIYHTSGIVGSYEEAKIGMEYGTKVTEKDILNYVCKQRLLFRPGEKYKYSNTGYFLLGLIVKRVSGKPLEEFAEQRIFGPLGMKDTFFNVDKDRIINNRAIGYVQNGSGGYRMLHQFNQAPPGGRGVNSNVEDMILWGQNLCENSIGGPEFLKLMTRQGVLNNGDTIDYAFGVYVHYHRGYKAISHDGYTGSFNTFMVVFPQQKLTVICLANINTVPSERLAYQIADVYLADCLNQD